MRTQARRAASLWGSLAALALVVTVGLNGCGSPAERTVKPSSEPDTVETLQEVTYDEYGGPVGLPRHYRWSDLVGQGAEPAGDEAFRNLRALGYRTVLSVDGAIPDVETAETNGLRYAHVPIGYDGITEEQSLRLIKAVATSEGPVYVHCHHGRHRGPAAAAVVRVALEGLPNEQAVQDLRTSGCSPRYTGLYRYVRTFRAPDAAVLAAYDGEIPSRVAPEGLVSAMSELARRWEHMGYVRDASWQTPPEHPDVSPAHEATLIWESLREVARLDEARGYGDRFIGVLQESEGAAKQLDDAIRSGDLAGADVAFAAVRQSCRTCHTLFRN